MPEERVRRATPADRPAAERLWLMFRHDMSQFTGRLPEPDGTFRSERLESAFGDPDWTAYLVTSDASPVGLALVRGLTGEQRVLNGFFVVRGARRTGIGLRAVHEIVHAHPGPWGVAFQDHNAGAVRFWREAAARIAGDDWTEERRPVAGRPDLPPDWWISFTAPADVPA